MFGELSTLPHPPFHNTFQGGLYLVAHWNLVSLLIKTIGFPNLLKNK